VIFFSPPAFAEGIKQFIGMKISPLVEGQRQDDIPGWNEAVGYLVDGERALYIVSIGSTSNENGVLIGTLSRSKEVKILDVIRVDSTKSQARNQKTAAQGGYRLTSCTDETKRILVGMVAPEKGYETCTHYSKNIKNVWEFDEAQSRFKKASLSNVYCFYPDAIDECSTIK
jgi:hypothetical protein